MNDMHNLCKTCEKTAVCDHYQRMGRAHICEKYLGEELAVYATVVKLKESSEDFQIVKMVREFYKANHQPFADKPSFPDEERRELRRDLLQEEWEEYMEAEGNNDLVEIADGLTDMIYIICGTAFEYGIPLSEVFREVHRSNMSKLGEDGKPVYREDGKIIKGPNYEPPKISKILKL